MNEKLIKEGSNTEMSYGKIGGISVMPQIRLISIKLYVKQEQHTSNSVSRTAGFCCQGICEKPYFQEESKNTSTPDKVQLIRL